jgi:hypothetical protein
MPRDVSPHMLPLQLIEFCRTFIDSLHEKLQSKLLYYMQEYRKYSTLEELMLLVDLSMSIHKNSSLNKLAYKTDYWTREQNCNAYRKQIQFALHIRITSKC